MRRERAVVTTPWKVTERREAEASRLAAWFDCPYVPRRDRSVLQVLQDEAAEALIVADAQPIVYHAADPEHGTFFHPSLAWQRARGLMKGQPDRLVTAMQVAPGDTLVDATLGFGVDTFVLAAAAGRMGRVIAIESSWLLARLFEYTLAYGAAWYPAWADRLQRIAAPIEVCIGSHTEWLRMQPDASVDAVYFDPMFRHATKRASNVDRLRPFAATAPLSSEAWTEAARVVRRCVVLKERPGFGQFERFGLEPDRPRGRTAFGVWRKE
ncbi:class I SAM-dependent methyltransferase [Alicyclobacillus cycloheptanicus]|nr:class I SAM-dependent methyltransferase [Alicyclobacillus cycloheptanicus]